MSKNEKQTNVLIVHFVVLQFVYEAIMPLLREKLNARFVVIASKGTAPMYRDKLCTGDDKVYLYEDLAINHRTEVGFGLDIEEESKLARGYEEKYALSYYREIIQQDRQISTPFLSHAPWSPYSSNEVPGDEELVRLVNGSMQVSEELLEDEKIDLALLWPVTVLTASMAAIAEHRGIPVTYPYNSKFKGFCLWASSAYQDDEIYKESFEKIGEREPLDEDGVVPPEGAVVDKASMDRRFSIPATIKEILKRIFFRLEFLVLDLMKFDFRIKNRVGLFLTIRQILYSWWFYKKISAISESDIESFGKKPFLFYAFAQEPEFSVQGKSKEFNDQAAIVRQLAMCLPAGYELVIKEHSRLGQRDIGYYKDLLKFPNIRMAHPAIRGVDLTKKARAVANMAGTVTLEASLLGKAALEFSTHSTFAFLPNVHTVTDLHTLPEVLKEAMRELDDKEIDTIKRTSARVPEAIENISFEGSESPFFDKAAQELSSSEIERIVELLIDVYERRSTK